MTDPVLKDPTKTSFLGAAAAQSWVDFFLWEWLLNENPQLRGIIELGTWQGGFALYLLLQALQREMRFVSVDMGEIAAMGPAVLPGAVVDLPIAALADLQSHLWRGDVFPEEDGAGRKWCTEFGWPYPGSVHGRLKELLADDDWHPLVLHCDNGDKPKEFVLFAPLLRPGDFITVHDWLTEIQPADIEPVAHLVEPAYHDLSERVEGQTRIFKRR